MDLQRFLIIKSMARVGADWYATVDAVHYVAAKRPETFGSGEQHTFEEWEEIIGIKRVKKERHAAR